MNDSIETKKVHISYKITTALCVAALFVILFLAAIRIVVKNVMYEKLGIYNSFVAFFLEGDNSVVLEDDSRPVNIDWASIYPYAQEDIYIGETAENAKSGKKGIPSLISSYESKINSVKDQISWYTTDGLVGQAKFTEAAAAYESLIGWKVQEQDYDGVIFMNNGHLTCVCPNYSGAVIDEIVESIVCFKDFLSEKDINLAYVMVPFKVDEDGSYLPLGIEDYSASNSDELLAKLKDKEVDYIDLRELEKQDGLSHYDMFYLTDHHWNVESAVWACDKVSSWLSSEYGYDYQPEIFASDSYDKETFENIFLGSYGRRVTLSKASPENFRIMLPKNDFKYHLTMPEKNIDVTGSFDEVFIDYDMLKITDYYEMDAYSSYVTLRKYVAVIENENAVNPDKKIMILRDSFGNIFVPYFAQMYGIVEVLDVSEFTGSIKSYIEESNPDTVLLLYNPTMIEKINWASYTSSKYDFR